MTTARIWQQMGMPVSVRIVDADSDDEAIDDVVDLLEQVNQRFSPYLESSEVSRFARGEIDRDDVSPEMSAVLKWCDMTRDQTEGYFDPIHLGRFDPSGLVKGLAIQQASDLLTASGFRNHYVEIGGDIQAVGVNEDGDPWRVGIRNPFNRDEQVKVLAISDLAVATSGTAIRGNHIYDPHNDLPLATSLVSLTVIAQSIFDADRMATAAFAMGSGGIEFIGELDGFEGYAISSNRTAIATNGFADHVL